MNLPRALSRVVASAFMGGVLLASAVAFAEDRPLAPPLRALPPETFLIAHSPSLNQFIQEFRGTTRLGDLWLQRQRVEKLLKLIEVQDPTEYAQFVSQLGEGGFKVEDAYDLLAGPAGFAVATIRRENLSPTLVVMAWAEPAGDITERIFRLMDKEAEAAKDDPESAKLDHVEMHGLKVYHWLAAERHAIPDPKFARLPPEFQSWPQEQRDAWYKQRKEAQQTRVEVDRFHAWVTRAGKRMLTVATLPTHQKEFAAMLGQPDAKVDFDTLIGTDDAARMAAGFFAGHLAGGEGKTAVASWFSAPELHAAFPAGTPAIEVFMDTKALLQTVVEEARRGGPAKAETMKKWFQAAGLETLGPMGGRWTIDRGIMRMGGIQIAPAPRSGFMNFLDLEAMAPEPPAWVSAQAVGYSHFAFDLEKIYSGVRSAVTSVLGEKGAEGFRRAEAQAMATIGVELPALLAGFGAQIRGIALRSKPPGQAGGEPAAGAIPVSPDELNASDRLAIVWQIRNEEVVIKGFKALHQMGTMFLGDALKLVEEQGFQGMRFDAGETQIGLFIGRGALVFALGEGVSEEILAALRAPGEASASLSSAPWFQRARELCPPAPSWMYSATDFAVVGGELYTQFWDILEAAMTSGAKDPTQAASIDLLREVLPSVKEMENTMGAVVYQWRCTAQGIEVQSAFEFAPIDKK